MLRLRFFICLLLLLFSGIHAQNEATGLVNWLSFKEAQEQNKKVQKPFIIDFYTDWCGWCKHMMRTTYSNPGIAAYLNQNFYALKFNAEGKDTIEYNGKVYKPISKEPKTPHEFTLKMLGQQLSYPSTVFVTNNFEYTLLTQGYLEDKKIEPLLVFMVENAWRTSVFDEFNKNFNKTFVDTVFRKVQVKTYRFQELEKLQKKKPKKVLVNVGASFCNSCKVMQKTTFVDSSVAKILNEKFYLVDFNAESSDTVLFKNEKFAKSMVNNFPLHTLPLKLSNNRFSLPMMCVLDEQLNTIDVLNFYYSPQAIKPVLLFIGNDVYKKKTWQEFIKEYSVSGGNAK